MLELKGVTKNYYVGDQTVEALKGVSLSFRENEFVSILGPSGCGKTTLLNIIGGLDRYTLGDIIINGISTKLYSDSDWDSYRNHSIGFVFQSYNLITHQTVLSNVELALTLSGVSPAERKERAVNALNTVGLSDQLNKLPAQLSGGQMQRVAIARALVNNPDIILADEPTGALDTETSVQVMQLLKEISKTKLVIMVTHNPELANEYSTRIINLKDGLIRDDSNPYEYTNSEKIQIHDQAVKAENDSKKHKKPSMSLLTALSLSLKNLGTKKARTFLTSFAGSIGIIGIALILSLSAGFNSYIANVQKDTLSNYPVTIRNDSMDMTSFITAFMGSAEENDLPKYPKGDEVISNPMLESIMNSYTESYGMNDLSAFKKYLDGKFDNLDKNKISTIQYGYKFNMNLFRKNADNSYSQVNQIAPMSHYMPEGLTSDLSDLFTPYYTSFKQMMATNNSWDEMLGSDELLKSQYELLAGDWPTFTTPKAGESWPLMVVVDEYNSIPDYALYMMGILSDADVRYIFSRMALNMKYSKNQELVNAELNKLFPGYKLKNNFKFSDIVGKKYQVLLNGEFYTQSTVSEIPGTEYVGDNAFKNYQLDESEAHLNNLLAKNDISLEIVGIVRLKESAAGGALSKNMYYTPALTQTLLQKTLTLDAVKDQLKYSNITVAGTVGTWDVITAGFRTDQTTVNTAYTKLGIAIEEKPNSISIYPTSFENKDYVVSLIDDYNKGKPEEEQIKYTDYLGMMMDSVTVIINAITYVLIAFVSISLIVSSIMIGVITYISVLERTKEIGILRAIGASKKDIARVFNAETIIVGFVAGALGILITVILNVPISLIIEALSGIAGVSALPPIGGIILVVISVVLTLIAGIIPSHIASKKDPVVALRSE